MTDKEFQEWPRDRHGNLLCTANYPMPVDKDSRNLGWVHVDGEDILPRLWYCPNCQTTFRPKSDA